MGMKAYHGNPCDGHTLKDAVLQAEYITDLKLMRFMLTVGTGDTIIKVKQWCMLQGEGRVN